MREISLEMLEKIKEEVKNVEIRSDADLTAFKKKYGGKEGLIGKLTSMIKEMPPEARPSAGRLVNEIKNLYEEKIKKYSFLHDETHKKKTHLLDDPTLPACNAANGALSPVSIVIERVVTIFEELGYRIADGPEVEDDWHNFTSLNFPKEHPARDMQDTLFIRGFPLLLRTHTSNVQIRVLEKCLPPVRIVCPGRVYRNERISARAHFQFHQIEGLYVDRDVSFAGMKHDIIYFTNRFFGEPTRVRFRPSYFPFTEPSAEVDVSCLICGGNGCRVCKNTGWVEIMGCGVVHPAVLKNCGIDPEEWQGFAFGMGVERIAMLKFRIPDIRLFYSGNIEFARQFSKIIF